MPKARQVCERPGSLVKDDGRHRSFIGLPCGTWSCRLCGHRLKRRAIARAKAGAASKFVTLTCNPARWSTPAEARKGMGEQVQPFFREVARRLGVQKVEYIAFVEQTERGWPHVHLLVRGPFLRQAVLSEVWAALTGAPIVDVRAVKRAKEAVAYVAKYLTKAPAGWHGFKRVWASQGWLGERPERRRRTVMDRAGWHWIPEPVSVLIAEQMARGSVLVGVKPTRLRAPPQAPPRSRWRLRGGLWREDRPC